MQKRIADYGIKIGTLRSGPRNKITDVAGVTVGHATIHEGTVHTGVTALLPRHNNIFENKVVGASHVMNGFGKTIGTVQIDELGTIETPILLTNTLSIGTCTDALLKYMVRSHEKIGNRTGTVNPIVGECNDMTINDIRAFGVQEKHAFQAIQSASSDFREGAVGAGTGMRCFGLKGGIGSASRVLSYPHGNYTIGALVLSNFGQLQHMRINGVPLGRRIAAKLNAAKSEDKGSIIVLIATDLPVSSRQLKRIIKRSAAALARTGSYFGNGSGDIFIGFSTANTIHHEADHQLTLLRTIHEGDIEQAFIGAADSVEEAILNSLITAEATVDRYGNPVHSLQEFIGWME